MKIDITSFCFGFKIEKKNDSGTPAWATSIAQAPKNICYIDPSRDGFINLLTGMMRKSHSDFNNLKVKNVPGIDTKEEPKSDRDRMMFSVFEKVFVNGMPLKSHFTLSFEREHSDSHNNRLHICYAKYLTYNGQSNKTAMLEMAKLLGCKAEACWFVSEIYVKEQEELHFTAVVVDSEKSLVYSDSKVRKKEWEPKIVYHDDSELDLSCRDLSDNIKTYLTAIRTKPFVLLAGISGTGKSRIVRKLAQATLTEELHKEYCPEYSGNFNVDRWTLHSPENFELIQVKPNWHNSMDVVGFKSNIGEKAHYEFTPFVEFIAKAWHHTEVPFFLCLDEMNLAPVEEYFAEFLSAIESRSINEDGLYQTDPIIKPFDDFGVDVCAQMTRKLAKDNVKLEWQFRKIGLTLPPNLIVMGTVNMDETTFSFSRKVLDRAMSIEMNDVNYDDFLSGKTEEEIPVLTEANILLVNRPIKSQEVASNIDADSIMEYLKAVNSILEGTPFKLGYRAANEALLYVAAAKSFKNDNTAAALDDFTLMKILSRIEGDDSKLKTTFNDPDCGDDLLYHLKKLFTSTFSELEECKSLNKLTQMINILERDHFVSFWG